MSTQSASIARTVEFILRLQIETQQAWKYFFEEEVDSDFWQQQPLEEMERVRDFFIGAGSSKTGESPR